MIDLFPFDLVEKGSTILLYGLGRCGHTYIEQNKQLKWCNIDYVSDKAKPEKELLHLYVKPENIPKVISKVDKIVIAISYPDIVKQIRAWLVEKGINEKVIVNSFFKDNFESLSTQQKDLKKIKIRKFF